MDREATSRALSQELGSFAREQVSARKVRPSLQKHGLSARRPWLRLLLTLHQRQERLQWFCLQHQNGRICVWRHHGERTLAACIRHRQTSPSPGVMTWSAIGYTSQSPLVRIDGTLNSTHYISGIVRSFLDMENVRLFPLPARSPNLLPIENVWFMFAD
ncbi:uncharacterized protein TNCV_2330961 [Trichonephila clavipes]|nr:uncharacterized protein TNCV_2330961 [Trichonephila clavipes]